MRATALALLALLVPAAAVAANPYAGTYEGQTSGPRFISLEVGPHGRLDMYVELYKRCSSGAVIESPTQTDPTDHYRVNRDGSFRIRGSFLSTPSFYGGPGGAFATLAHFSMRGWIANGRVVGWVTQTEVVFDRKHHVADRCAPIRLQSFVAQRTAR